MKQLNKENIRDKFDICMGKDSSIFFSNFQETRSNKFRYSFFKKLYNRNLLMEGGRKSNDRQLKIPKIIHQIWLGPKKIPDKFIGLMKDWQEKHPKWEYKLWKDHDLQNFEFKLLGKYFDESENYGQKSDILRYEILYQYGGLYVDVDFECIKAFDELNIDYHFYCGLHPPHHVIEPNYPIEIGNALIGSIKGHPILAKTCELIKERWYKIYNAKKLDSSWKVVFSTMYPLRDACIKDCYKEKLRNIVFPAYYFFPFLPSRYVNNIEKGKGFDNPEKETYAIHHWGESWFK